MLTASQLQQQMPASLAEVRAIAADPPPSLKPYILARSNQPTDSQRPPRQRR